MRHDPYHYNVSRRSNGKAAALAVIALVVLAALILVPFLWHYWTDSYFQTQANAVFVRILAGTGAISVLFVIVRYGVPAYNDWQDRALEREQRRKWIAADAGGMYPLLQSHVEQEQYLRATQIATVLKHYPSFTGRANSKELPHEEVTPALPALNVPTFNDLLNADTFGKDKPFVLAYSAETGESITGKVGALYTTAIGGLPETGKSTTARFLASQMALKGCKLVLADPHGQATGDAADDTLATTLEPLTSAFLMAPATDRRGALDSIKYVKDALDLRIAGRTAHYPILLILDEFSTLMRDEDFSDVAAPLLESLATEGRKFLVFAMLLGQQWSVSRSGGGELRDVLASAYVHRLKMKQASMMTGLTRDEIGYPVDKLQPGQVLLYKTNGDLIPARVPLTTRGDMQRVAGLLTDGATDKLKVDLRTDLRTETIDLAASSVANLQEIRSASVPTVVHTSALNAKELQVRDLLRQKAGVNDVLRQIWDVDPKRNDAAVKRAREEYQEIVAKLVSGV